MKNISSVQCGIKPLEGVLNRMVDGINARTPVAGAGILITESNGSVLISQSKKDDDKGQTGSQGDQGGGGGGVPVTIQAFDSNNNPVMLTVMTDGSGFSASTLAWQPVAVIDPATCAQSTITVLEKPSS